MLNHFPIHPFTGLHAIGFTDRGRPVWPVMGGAEDGGDPGAGGQPSGQPGGQPPAGQPGGQPPADQQESPVPKGTPIAEMSREQLIAHFRHHDQRKSAQLAKFGDMTPEQVQQLQARNEELENAQLSASDKAIRDAEKQAAATAKAEAEAVWKPKYLASELKACAAQFISGEKLTEFMEIANPAALVNEAGEIDSQKVTDKLTKLFGQPANGQQSNGARDWGQHGGQPPGAAPGEGGRAEARRRQGIKT